MDKIKLPLRYIQEGGYIFDADNKMILEIRGWGWIQKLKKEEIGKSQAEFQDDLAKYIVTLLNEGLLDTSFVK
jgi:hypothetical protein